MTDFPRERYPLKYPVLMVHGMGYRDEKQPGYWGRIPDSLEALGCKIYYGHQDSAATAESNGRMLQKRINEVLAETGAEKVNVIAHSKGGLDSRYAISSLGMGDKIASLTTMSTPHNGSKTVDLLLKVPDFLVRCAGFLTDSFYRRFGDSEPKAYDVFYLFSTKGAEKFNLENPNDPRVFYQSYAFIMKNPASDLLMWLTYSAVRLVEGDNDGLLTPANARFTNFKGVYTGRGRRGISHADEVDVRRRRLSKKERSENGLSDITEIYADAVRELYQKGF